MRFFVYDLIDPRTGETFYVGKGQKSRPSQHTRDAIAGVRSAKCDRIREILAGGAEVKVEIVKRFDKEDDAYRFESARIRSFERGKLTNIACGGRGGKSSAGLAGFTPAMARNLAHALWMHANGYKMLLAGVDLCALARHSLDAVISREGIDRVKKVFSRAGVLLLTEPEQCLS